MHGLNFSIQINLSTNFIAKKFNQTECTCMQIDMSTQQVLSQLNQRLFILHTGYVAWH